MRLDSRELVSATDLAALPCVRGEWVERVGIRDLLWNPTAIGVFIWNHYRREPDPETGCLVKVKKPRAEWKVRYELGLEPVMHFQRPVF